LRDPWVIIQGQKDEVCNAAAVDTFAAQMPDAELVRLPKVGHGFSVERNWVPQFLAAYQTLLKHAAPPPPAAVEVGDLPLTIVPVPTAAPGVAPVAERAQFALLLTGDGGWAGLDQDVSAQLAAKGLPVVGLSTLRYFWKERTPEETTQDVERILRHYLAAWNKQSVVLVGYSFGADVLPFIVSRLSPDLRARITSLNLIGLSENANFEISVAGWLPGTSTAGRPVVPELAKEKDLPIQCFYGEGESDSACPGLAGAKGFAGLKALRVGTGHHLGGRYGEIADDILASR
jgi:type IV secretory pathway VirJ component